MKYRIPLSYNPIDTPALVAILQKYDGLHHDELITGFEKKLKEITQAPHVVALNSGTAAIHLGLKALGVGSGDEVLVSTFTYVGSINPITYLGAKPVFIDSERETWNMDPSLLETAIQERIAMGAKPKVILVVHAYGMPANMTAIMSVAHKYHIAVLEDAAEALGARYQNQHVGTIGDIGIISFNNNKTLTTYGGGALLAKNEEVANKIRFWSRQSRENKPYYEHREEGYSYRMGPLNAAYGLAGLENLNANVEKRRSIHKMYKEGLKTIPWVQFLDEPAGYYSSRWLSTVILDLPLLEIDQKVKKLVSEGIETRHLWNPMHKQPAYKHFVIANCGVSEVLFKSGLCLPSVFLQHDQNQVIDALRK